MTLKNHSKFTYLAVVTIVMVLFGLVHAPLMASAMQMDMTGCQHECSMPMKSEAVIHCIDASKNARAARTTIDTHSNNFSTVHACALLEMRQLVHLHHRSNNDRIPWIRSFVLKTQQKE